MIPYLFLAAWVLLCWLLNYRGFLGRRAFLVAVLVPCWALLALRGASVGEDTSMYLYMARVADGLSWGDVLVPWGSIIWNMNEWGYGSTVDMGYLALCKLVMAIFDDPQWVLAVCSAVICAGFGRFLYHCDEDVAQSFWCFLCSGLYMFAFNGMRQMLAMAIGVQCICSMRRGHLGRAILFVAVASLVHKSSLVFLFVILVFTLLGRKQSAYASILILTAALPLFVGVLEPLVSYISPQYASYFSNNYWEARIGGIILWWAVIMACLFAAIRGRAGASLDAKTVVVCSFAYLALEACSLRVSILERVALYMLPFVCQLLPQAKALVPEKNRWWFSLGANLVLLFMFVSYAASPTRAYMFCT